MGKVIQRQIMSASVSGAATHTSSSLVVTGLVLGSLHIITTGTPTGVFELDVSNNYDPINPSTATWAESVETDLLADLDAARLAVANGTAGAAAVENIPLSASAIRLRYVHASGSGTVTVHATAKE